MPPSAPREDCSLCGYKDFRLCNHPWGKAFDEWPERWLSDLRAAGIMNPGPRPGS